MNKLKLIKRIKDKASTLPKKLFKMLQNISKIDANFSKIDTNISEMDTNFSEIDTNISNLKNQQKKMNHIIINNEFLKGIQSKYKNKEKINVVLIVTTLFSQMLDEYEYFIETFQQSEYINFNIIFLPPTNKHRKTGLTIEGPEFKYWLEEYSFAKQNYPLLEIYDHDTKSLFPIEKFDIDLIFFPDPWLFKVTIDIQGLDTRYAYTYSPHYFSTQYLYCYIGYGFFLAKDSYIRFNNPVHNTVYRFFLLSYYDKMIGYKENDYQGYHFKYLGYPRVDNLIQKSYNQDCWKVNKKNVKKIIWAPHWTFKSSSKRSNFLLLYNSFLKYIQDNSSSLECVFKPHPNLGLEIVKTGTWTQEKWDDYTNSWSNLPNGLSSTHTPFNQYLATMDAIITDSVSFLALSYFVNKPIILIQSDTFNLDQFNDLGKIILKGVYRVKNDIQSINDLIEDVVIKGNDRLKLTREKILHEHLDIKLYKEKQASLRILDHLINAFRV